MANGVFDVRRGIELDLTRDDLGHPGLSGLWDVLRSEGYAPGRLQCLECRDRQPDCPQWMFLRFRNGRREAVHHTRGIRHPTTPESDAHKALKERIAAAATGAGFEAVVEAGAQHRRRRTDVLVKGNVLLGCEAQLSYATAASVRKRTKVALADGITPLWATNDPYAQLIDQAPWARIDRMSWDRYANDTELPVRGGVRTLVMEDCRRLRTVCPDKRAGRRCSGWHARWEPRQLRFDDLIVRAAAGEFVPYADHKGSRVAHWFWVLASDLAKVDTTANRSEEDVHERDQIMPAARRPFERICRYGEESDVRSKTRIRDDKAEVLARLADPPPLPQLLTPPPLQVVRPGVCGRSPHPCPKPARLYAGGWACDDHKP